MGDSASSFIQKVPQISDWFYHWNENVILTKFSSLAALEIVILTTSSAASDEKFKMVFLPNIMKLHMLIVI